MNSEYVPSLALFIKKTSAKVQCVCVQPIILFLQDFHPLIYELYADMLAQVEMTWALLASRMKETKWQTQRCIFSDLRCPNFKNCPGKHAPEPPRIVWCLWHMKHTTLAPLAQSPATISFFGRLESSAAPPLGFHLSHSLN